MSALSGWENFYVIVGTSAGALIGLTFVAVTLTRGGAGARRGSRDTSVQHADDRTLWRRTLCLRPAQRAVADLVPPALILGLCGLVGVIYSLIVTRRLRRFGNYAPVLEDWLANSAAPLTAYLALIVSAALLPSNPEAALFIIAGAILLLLFDSIHNAWMWRPISSSSKCRERASMRRRKTDLALGLQPDDRRPKQCGLPFLTAPPLKNNYPPGGQC